MDVQSEEVTDDVQDLIKEREECMPAIISSFSEIDHYSKLLDNMKLCTKYLSTYDVSNVEAELLQYIMPVLKKHLTKVYEDNFLLSDTVSDEFVLNIIKDNLQVALGFLQFIKAVLEFLSQRGEINLGDFSNTPTDLAFLILITFEHCNNSTDDYKNAFNVELLEVFHATQEVHLLFLKLFELYVVIQNEPSSSEEVRVLIEVLGAIENMSAPLSEMNIKSMGDNWKSYTAITQKFSALLSDTIDLRLPIQRLTSEIHKNLTSISHLDEIDAKLVSQVIKITSFLIKVVLKLCDIFWACLGKNCREILDFCCTIYSFPVDLYRSQGYAADILDLIENALYSKSIEPFLLRLSNDTVFVKIFSPENLLPCEQTFGLMSFLGYVLKLLVLNEQKFTNFKVDVLIGIVFKSASQCYVEFFWPSGADAGGSLFDNLILNITAVVSVYDECYAQVERILFENLLQEHVWNALLALEVWTLLLHNSSANLRMETLSNLIKQHRIINFGVYTSRPEEIYMKCMMQRVFRMLSGQMKNEVVSRYNPISNINSWKMMQFRDFPIHQRLMIEGLSMNVVEKIAMLKKGGLGLKDFTFLAESMEVLSTANFNTLGLNPSKLANAVYSLWEYNVNFDGITTNNLFRYFIGKLGKITGVLIEEFSYAQFVTLLTQLKTLSSNDEYKLLACDVLLAASKKQIDHRTQTLIVNIIQFNLLSSTKGVIKQNALEVIHHFVANNKYDVVKGLARNSKEMQAEISNSLRGYIPQSTCSAFDTDYLMTLASLKFQHECVAWKRDANQPRLKKLKVDETIDDGVKRVKEKQTHLGMKTFKATLAETDSNTVRTEEDKAERVSEVIDNIKGEVKCLMGVLKTEKLTRKNASDIRLIANQLLSL